MRLASGVAPVQVRFCAAPENNPLSATINQKDDD
jgi:hypothetical protein